VFQYERTAVSLDSEGSREFEGISVQAEALYDFAASRAYYTIAKRTRGDYETDVPVSDDESLEIIERSQIFIETAKQRLGINEIIDSDA
jgi:uncharacterized protein (UPF0332 family)